MLMQSPRAIIETGSFSIADRELSERAQRRQEALIAYGFQPQGVRYYFRTVTVVWAGALKRVLLAADLDVFPGDWAEALKILNMTGWMLGNPLFDDIGEPVHDTETDVWIWDLGCP